MNLLIATFMDRAVPVLKPDNQSFAPLYLNAPAAARPKRPAHVAANFNAHVAAHFNVHFNAHAPMNVKPLTPELSVAAQISASDVADLARAGFKSLICNRPDGESADQTSFEDIRAAAQAAGLQIHHLPAETGKVNEQQAAEFSRLLQQLPKPVLAYCRSGLRSTTMWALGQAAHSPLDQVLETAARAGYNLSGVALLMNRPGR